MKLINETRCTLVHEDVTFAPGEVKEIDKKIANIWLKIDGVKEYADPQEVKAAQEAAEKEIEALKAEIAKLKAAKSKTKKDEK